LTVKELIATGKKRLEDEGFSEADSDCFILADYLLGISRNDILIHPDALVSQDKIDCYAAAIDKRLTHVPVQYITGRQEFMGLTFLVDERVLIPRFDTEILVEEVLKRGLSGVRILDICTGSGCILLSLLHYMHESSGVGLDISEDALAVARENAARLGIEAEFIKSDICDGLSEDQRFDVIVSNPPYIRSDVIPTLMEEVKDHEPVLALDGSTDGLVFYRRIAAKAQAFLQREGQLIVEIGFDQGEDVKNIFMTAGYKDVTVIKDLAGLDRVVSGYRY
jgi:release factor glutamine methyltransferase